MSNEMLMKGMAPKSLDDIPYPVWAEPKLDEIRCRIHLDIATNKVMFDSYAGKPLLNLQSEFSELFYEFMLDRGIYELDTGVLVNGNFGDSQRWTRSKGWPPEKIDKKTGEVLAPALDKGMVKFYLFDLPTYPNVWRSRVKVRREISEVLQSYDLPFEHILGDNMADAVELQAYFERARSLGLEGVMAKTYEHKYRRGKHTGDWFKLKPSDTVDGKVAGMTEAVSKEGVPLGRVGSVDVEVEDGSKASPGGFEHSLAEDIFQNFGKYTGRWLEFDFMELDRAGGYRHPRFKRFREDK